MKKRNRQFLLSLTGIIALLLMWSASGYMPGTLYFDTEGESHGTGTRGYFYESGELKLEDRYIAGQLVEETWYKPDGSIVAIEQFRDESGVGYYLREDGSVRVKMTYVHGVAHGPATYFSADGRIERVVNFIEGREAPGE
ncbi:MAG: hypothetical protein IH986_06525 [Planctomycetes bacterium]|nr:hypothetical protein [Planctomycetota bacterium]